jgi:hypothetical protein
VTADEFFELCQKMKALGVQGFKFDGAEVAFYPPEPTWPENKLESEVKRPSPLDEHDAGTAAGRRAIVRAQLEAESKDLYGSAG